MENLSRMLAGRWQLRALVLAALVAFSALAGLSWRAAEAAPGTGTLLGTDAVFGNLIRVDPATGAGAIVGPTDIGLPVPALAVQKDTGVIYAGTGGGLPLLFTLDKATGAATFVGDTGLGLAAIGALDFSPNGTLYASVNIVGDGGTGSDHLATIDKATGAATVVGPFGFCGDGCTIEGMEAIAFDASGTLWGALSARGAAGAPGLYTIDPATGAATFVAPIEDADGLPSGGVVSLQFACDGTLYAGTATGIGVGDGGFLGTVDTATGLFTFAGAVSATGGPSLGALAFQDSCNPDIEKAPRLANLWLCNIAGAPGCANKASGVEELNIDVNLDRPVTSYSDKGEAQTIGSFEFEVRYDAKFVSVDVEAGELWRLGDSGGPSPLHPDVTCSTIRREGSVQFACITKGKERIVSGPGTLAVVRVRATADVYSMLVANQLNGIATQLINQDCQLADLQGHPIKTDLCDDADVTIRYLEGDVHADCIVDAVDQQQIAFRWGSRLGNLLYNSRMDLEPSQPIKGDGDIDAKDLQFVYGRHGSTCKAPHPAQDPVDPKAKPPLPPV